VSEQEFEVVNNAAAGRWEARAGDDVLGYAEYHESPGQVVFTHTVVEPEHEGKGIGSRLARTALDDAVERKLRITPVCPFIRSYLRRHEEYGDTVDMPSGA
jgi:predicted GNAT family acetyltransferase